MNAKRLLKIGLNIIQTKESNKMSTIVGINNYRNNKVNGDLTEEELKKRVNNTDELDEDTDAEMLNMADLSDIATAMALINAGLKKISDIVNVEIPGDDAIDLSEVF